MIDVVNSFRCTPTSYDVYKLVIVPSLALALPCHTTSEVMSELIDGNDWTSLCVTSKPWLVYCDSRLGLPLSLTSSMLRVQLYRSQHRCTWQELASLGPMLEMTFAR